MKKLYINLYVLILLALLFVLKLPGAQACQVPVFRYALERWEPAPYEAVVFHRAPFTNEEKTVYESLRAEGAEERGEANFITREVDLSSTVSDDDRKLWASQQTAPLPRIVILPPPTVASGTAIWSAPLTSESIHRLLDSPARQKIAEQIIAGTSAVWVLLEGPKKEENEAAAAILIKQIAGDQKEITLPDGAAESSMQGGPELKIAFSVLRIPHADPAEEIFLKTFQNLAPDFNSNLPVAIPVFGRGRAPTALERANITSDNIRQADEFMCGPCACEIKERNPGIDLLFRFDWNKAFAGDQPGASAIPPLTGLPQLTSPANATPSPAPTPQISPTNNNLVRNSAILVLAAILIVAFLGARLKSR